jgi:hypothetical protein
MFVYQNKEGQICVTFADNKPVEAPEFVIAIDKEAKALYMVSGEIAPMPEEDVPSDEVVEDTDEVEDPEDVVVDDTPTDNEEPTEPETEE